ncbi:MULTISPECIES: class IIb bacteriocin, lactobin A/cerein 7B family [Acidithiobacillus]|uniref:class IIb bacteriocin, lactobin A/cerein 7B family n=1 Tax=Acidithiobacillus TaxID=119977 RepID=UPI00214722CB|nr:MULTISPECIES: class IIb bacteriocin, lactobin A/cerein 7B family [Acidithiobacillus]MCR1347451.1 class IIb bacteriocin, lactobin A/cerein 7B family [Acidithiobacillus ferrooxidans]MCR1354891.1 class IIb bacteriocin, lactobin A/cerein 7B family [Acidithiobacillus ferrooxidans]MDA8246620.1 class IIb bacteriocin, lactobin A/cerein 7B family [Acidithiobacillus sp.]
MSDLAISNIRELDMDEIQQVSGGYIPIGNAFGALGLGMQGASLAAAQAGYSNLATSLNWGSLVFGGFSAYFGW